MTIAQIYQKYQIMPSLQLHMRRVTAVAATIVDHFDQPLERPEIVSACLLHDLGNILKFDLLKFPEFLEPEGLAYWQHVKSEYQQKYGINVHDATIMMAQTLGVSPRTLELISSIGYGGLPDTFQSKDLAAMICEYADLRVTPLGITSLATRWADLVERYGQAAKRPDFEKLHIDQGYQVESQQAEQTIFSHCSIRPDQITEASLGDTIKALADFIVV